MVAESICSTQLNCTPINTERMSLHSECSSTVVMLLIANGTGAAIPNCCQSTNDLTAVVKTQEMTKKSQTKAIDIVVD